MVRYQYRTGARVRHIASSSGGKASYLAKRLVDWVVFLGPWVKVQVFEER